jgi:hypothetical protein
MVLLAAVLTEVTQAQPPSLVGWWKLDDGAGTAAKDSSGKKHNGTLQGAPKWVAGRVDGALAFSGSDYVQISYAADLALNDFTLFAWVNLAAEPAESGVCGTRSGGENTFDFKVEAAQIHGDIGTGSGWLNTTLDITASDTGTNGQGGDLKPGTWYALAYVIDNAKQQVRLYVDGDLKKTITISGKPLLMQSGESMQIGGTGYSGEGMNGKIDDVMLFRRALNTEQVAGLMTGTMPAFLKAEKPDPADGATGVSSPMLQWTPGETALFVDVYVGTTPDLTAANRVKHLPFTTKSLYLNAPPLEPGQTYYWRVDAVDAKQTLIATGDVWSFTMAPVTAFSPSPRNGDKWVDPNVVLSWQPGQDAYSSEVYLSTNKDDVVNGAESAFKGSQADTSLKPPVLTPATTYYWRVDEIDSMDERHAGDVWSFTTGNGGGGVKAEYFRNMTVTGAPFLTQIEPSIDHSWGDPGGPTAGVVDNFSARWTADLEIAVADTYTFIANTDDGVRVWLNDNLIIDDWIAKSASDVPSVAMALEPGIYSLKMEYYEATGGASAQLYWQAPDMAREIIPPGPLQPPVRAKAIYPKDGDVNVPQDLTLMWSVGEKAVTHDVYFGADEAAVAAATPADAGLYKGSQAKDENTFVPGALEWNKTYYWRIDEVNSASADSPWKGSVWSFTTADFIVVDDFESYTDEDVGRIFQTWIDGWGYTTPAPGNPGNGTGSTVGYVDPPFAEHAIVHGGGSSMPLGFNNADSPFYSEAERTFDSPQNWTVNGVTTLSLQVRGYPAVTTTAVTETGGKMSLTGSGTDIWGTSDQFTYAYKTLNGDGTIVARVVSIGPGTQTWAKGGVMIRDSLNGNSASAQMCLTANSDGAAGNGATFQNRASTGLDMSANDATSNTTSTSVIAPPYWVKIERVGDTFNGYVSSDGNSWTIFASTDVVMSDPVYIGICVTAHIATEQRTFQFESIKTTGSVTGSWQGAAISSPQYNSAQNLYVALQDSTGKVAVATDATAVNSASWIEVKMPLSSFTGVSASKIKKIFIGVGSRTSPAADGTGMLFIDDIRVIKP